MRVDEFFYEKIRKLDKKHYGGISNKARLLIKAHSTYKVLNLNFEQLQTLPSSVVLRCEEAMSYGNSIVLLGDDDLHSIYLAKHDCNIVVIDIDPILLRFISLFLREIGKSAVLINGDVRSLKVKNIRAKKFDIGITLPPRPVEGWLSFVDTLFRFTEHVLTHDIGKEIPFDVVRRLKDGVCYYSFFDCSEDTIFLNPNGKTYFMDAITVKKRKEGILHTYPLGKLYEYSFHEKSSVEFLKRITNKTIAEKQSLDLEIFR